MDCARATVQIQKEAGEDVEVLFSPACILNEFVKANVPFNARKGFSLLKR